MPTTMSAASFICLMPAAKATINAKMTTTATKTFLFFYHVWRRSYFVTGSESALRTVGRDSVGSWPRSSCCGSLDCLILGLGHRWPRNRESEGFVKDVPQSLSARTGKRGQKREQRAIEFNCSLSLFFPALTMSFSVAVPSTVRWKSKFSLGNSSLRRRCFGFSAAFSNVQRLFRIIWWTFEFPATLSNNLRLFWIFSRCFETSAEDLKLQLPFSNLQRLFWIICWNF